MLKLVLLLLLVVGIRLTVRVVGVAAKVGGGILFGGRGVAPEAPHGRMERRVVAHHLRLAGCNEERELVHSTQDSNLIRG